MPMFLKSLEKVYRGFGKGEEYADCDIFSGVTHNGLPVVCGVFRRHDIVVNIFTKAATSDLDKEIEQIRKRCGPQYEWEYYNFKELSPPQQEEAAHVRGLLLDSELDEEAYNGIKNLIYTVELERGIKQVE